MMLSSGYKNDSTPQKINPGINRYEKKEAKPYEKSNQSTEPCKQQYHNNRGAQKQRDRQSEYPTRRNQYDGKFIEDDQQDPLHNYAVTIKHRILIANPPPQSPSSLEDQDPSSNNNDASSCVSSLSKDGSYCSSRHNFYHHDLKMHRKGETLHRLQLYNQKSPLQKSLSWSGGGPYQPSVLSPRKPYVFTNRPINKNSHTRDALKTRRGELENINTTNLNRQEVAVQRYLKNHCLISGVRSLDGNFNRRYHQRSISTSATHVFKRVPIKSSTKYHRKSIIMRSRFDSFSRQHHTNNDSPEILYTNSTYTSSMSLTYKSLSSSHGRENYQNNSTYDQAISGSSNNIANVSSLDQLPIIINGRVVHDIKRRLRSCYNTSHSHRWGGSGSIGHNSQTQNQVVGHSVSSIDRYPIVGESTKLELSQSFNSQSENILSSLEHVLNHSHTILVRRDTVTRSSGDLSSSMTGKSSVPSSDTAQGKKRKKREKRKKKKRRRSTKDEMKYLVVKIIPKPLQKLKVFLTKTKSCELKRSNGCLT